MSELTRRRLLAAGGAGAIATVAGCLGGDEPPQEDEPDPDDDAAESEVDGASDFRPSVPLLGDITVDNLHDEEHEVDVQVEIDGDTEAWETVTLEAREGGVTLERTWSADAESFRVIVRLDREEIVQRRPADWNDPDCINLLVLVDREGSLRVAGDAAGGPCAVD